MSDPKPSRGVRLRRWRRPRGRLGRRVASTVSLLVALGVVGTIYAALAPSGDAAAGGNVALDVRQGQQLFNQTCITCHGANLQGVGGKGPALAGVGQAAVYFQVRTGRMPLVEQGAQAQRKPVRFSETQIEQLAAYVQSIGGGPQIPSGRLSGGNVAQGGDLFRLNCASCHNLAGKGGALSAGKAAPNLDQSTDKEIYAAMLSGPANMPVFGDNQITPGQKRAIINYVQTLKAEANPGGNGLGRLGPVPEGLVIWLVGIGGLLVVIFWIGAKA